MIRDIVQSHILQTIALFAMEPPVSLDGEDIRNEKVFCLFFFEYPSLLSLCSQNLSEDLLADLYFVSAVNRKFKFQEISEV